MANAKAKSNSIVTTNWDMEAGTITINVIGSGSIIFDLNAVHPDNVTTAAYHGFTQRLVDAAALSRDPVTGRPADPSEKHRAIKQLADYYMSGASDWRVVRGAGEVGGLTLRAVAAVQGVSVEVMSARLDELAEKRGTTRKALLAKLAASDAVRAKMEELRGPVDSAAGDRLMAELVGD